MKYIVSVLQIRINLKEQSNYDTKFLFNLSSTSKTSSLNSPIAEDTIKANRNTLHVKNMPKIALQVDSSDLKTIMLKYSVKTRGEYRDRIIPIHINKSLKGVAFLKIIEGRFQGEREQVYYKLGLSAPLSSLQSNESNPSSKTSQTHQADNQSLEKYQFERDSQEQSQSGDVKSKSRSSRASKVFFIDQLDASFSAQSHRSGKSLRVHFKSLAKKEKPKKENAHQVKTSSSRFSWNIRIVILLLVVGLIYMVSEMIGDVQQKQEREKTRRKMRKNVKK